MQPRRMISKKVIFVWVCVMIFLFAGKKAVSEEDARPVDMAHEGVVVVKALSRENAREGKKRWSSNTGFVLGQNGEVLTSLLAVSGAGKIRVVKLDGRRFEANIKAYHQPAGLALLKTDIKEKGLFLASCGPDSAQRVMIASIPSGCAPKPGLVLRSITVASAEAAVPCYGVRHHKLVKINMDCPMGAAAAPLLTRKGKVAGVVLSAMQRKGGSECVYVFPVKKLRQAIRKLRQGVNVRVGWLGVAISQQKEGKGVLVRGVLTKSPAHKAGLRPGDVVRGINGKNISSPDELVDHINNVEPGNQLTVQVHRESEARTIQVQVGQRPLQIRRIQSKRTNRRNRGERERTRGKRPGRATRMEMQKELKRLRRRVQQLEQQLRKSRESDTAKE